MTIPAFSEASTTSFCCKDLVWTPSLQYAQLSVQRDSRVILDLIDRWNHLGYFKEGL
jgi:hypothetical protein